MITVSHLLWRVILAGLGFAAAIVVTVVIGTLGLAAETVGHHTYVPDDPANALPVIGTLLRGGLLLPSLVGVVWPAWLAAIVLAEATAARSLLLHLVVATGIAVAGVAGTTPLLAPAVLRVVVASGLTAGFVHWLIAGRSAGIRRPLAARGAPRPPHDASGADGLSEEDPRP